MRDYIERFIKHQAVCSSMLLDGRETGYIARKISANMPIEVTGL